MGFRYLVKSNYVLVMHPFEDIVYSIYDDIIVPKYTRNIKSTPDDITEKEADLLISEDMKINGIAREAFKSGYEKGFKDGESSGFVDGSKDATKRINQSLDLVKKIDKMTNPLHSERGKVEEIFNENNQEN